MDIEATNEVVFNEEAIRKLFWSQLQKKGAVQERYSIATFCFVNEKGEETLLNKDTAIKVRVKSEFKIDEQNSF
ncbi:hypothetical protein ACFL1Y_00700 [Patescibacteria group bacterium]